MLGNYLPVLYMLGSLCNVQCLQIDLFQRYLKDGSVRNGACEEQKNSFLGALQNGEQWALKMLDSYGRVPQAITQGNNIDLGTIDQCVSGDIQGRYCVGGLLLSKDALDNITFFSEATLAEKFIKPFTIIGGVEGVDLSNVLLISTCVPDACYPSDFFGPFGHDEFCVTMKDATTLDAGDISCLSFTAIIILLIVSSTCYDLYTKNCSKKPVHEVLYSFSAYTNAKKILETSDKCGKILFFSGVKVISMFWIIMGHRYQIASNIVINKADATEWVRTQRSGYVTMAPLAVDTFFFVSGALLSFTFLKKMRKKENFKIFLYYLHRFLRLTPALAMLFFFQMTLSRRLNIFPEGLDTTLDRCKRNWWSLFLYIQNYVAPHDLCLPHTWYLSVDMQLFIISPLILLPMVRYGKKFSYVWLLLLISASVIANALLFFFYDISPNDELYSNWSYSTHGRLPQWLLGILFGLFVFNYRKNAIKQADYIKNRVAISAIWIATIGVVFVLFYFFQDVMFNPTTLKSTLYYPLHKVAWCVCLYWLSFACLDGKAGFLNQFLSLPFFQILSKVTYCTYLIHLLIISQHAKRLHQLVYFSDYEMIRNSLADIILSYAFGSILTLMFESPIIVIEKIMFKKERL